MIPWCGLVLTAYIVEAKGRLSPFTLEYCYAYAIQSLYWAVQFLPQLSRMRHFMINGAIKYLDDGHLATGFMVGRSGVSSIKFYN